MNTSVQDFTTASGEPVVFWRSQDNRKPSLIWLQLIQMLDNSDRNMEQKNEKFCSLLSTYVC
jgi:hypothetical protein